MAEPHLADSARQAEVKRRIRQARQDIVNQHHADMSAYDRSTSKRFINYVSSLNNLQKVNGMGQAINEAWNTGDARPLSAVGG